MAGRSRRRDRAAPRPRFLAPCLALLGLATTLALNAPSAEAAAPTLVRTFGTLALQDGDLREPSDVAVGPDGLVYVADFVQDAVVVFDRDGAYQRRWAATDPGAIAASPATGNVLTLTSATCTITETDAAGTLVRTFGACGNAVGQLSAPGAIAVGPDGSVYVADTGHAKVQQFATTGTYVRTWGGNGSTDGKLREPTAIAVGPDGTIVVADRLRDDVQAFTGDGVFVRKWGATGNGDGQFVDPAGIAVAPDGSIVAVDLGDTTRPPSVQRFSSDGTFLARWGAVGSGAGQLDAPLGVAVAADGAVFVAESRNQRVQRFTPTGTPSARWGSFETTQRVRSPRGVSVDTDGRLLVADDGSERVQVFAPDGALAATWTTTDGPGGALLDPWDTAIDGTGRVLVVDRGHDRIQRYLADGTPDGGWGTTGTGDGQFTDPIGVAIAPDGDVLVSDAAARRVQQFHPDGTFVRAWPTVGALGGTFAPGGLDLDAAGNVYVVNTTNSRVTVLTATGTFVREWSSSIVRSVTVDRDLGVVYAANCSSSGVRRTDLSGGAALNLPTGGCATDVALRGDDYFVAEQPAFPGARVAQYAYPAGGGIDVALSVDSGTGTVGTPSQYHVTLVNTGTVTLTGLATTSTALADCTRSLADLPPRATVVVDCSYVPVPGDVGAFNATVSVDSDQTDAVSSAVVSVQVNGSLTAPTVREWRPSPTSLADGDPIGGTSAATMPALDVDATGDVHVAGTRAYPSAAQVQRFDRDGAFEDAFGTPGTGAGQLGRPSRMAVGPGGEVYVADCDNDRLQRFTAAGTFDRAWTEERTPSSRDTCSPTDVAVAPDGTAYVADAANDRIDIIDGDTLTPGWGSPGTGEGQFNTPNGIAVAPDGTVYVLDGGNRRVQHFTAEGTFLGSFGSSGGLLGQFRDPKAIDVDENGTVYVADRSSSNTSGGRRTQVFDGDGRLLVSLPIITTELAVHVDDGGSAHLYTYPYTSASSSALVGVVREYVIAAGPVVGVTLTTATPQVTVGATADFTVRVDNLGTVPLTGASVDSGGLTGCSATLADLAVGANRTITCSSTATIGHIGRHHLRATVGTDQTPPASSIPLAVEVLRATVAQFGGLGNGDGEFDHPRGMAVNWQGDLYVADCDNDRFVHLSTDGQFLDDRLTGDCPIDVALAPSGNLLVLLDEGVVQEFLPDGSYLRWWSTGTTTPGAAWAIDVDEAGNVYVSDAEAVWYTYEDYFDGFGYTCCIEVTHPPYGNNLVRRFSPDGTFLGQWGGYSGRYQLTGMWINDGLIHLVDNGGVSVTGLDGTQVARLPSLNGANDVAVDRFGHVWVTGGDKVRELTPAGNLLAEYRLVGADGITVDRDNVYVSNGNRITKIGIGTPLTALAGSVTETGAGRPPVAGAFVAALRASDLTFVRGATADADGFYRMEVPPGTYLLEFYDPTGSHRFEWYDNKPAPGSLDDVTRVTVGPSEERRADAALNLTTGAIRGTVTRSGALPEDGLQVIALRNGTPVARATTDSSGTYLITGLTPGSYTVVFLDPTGRTRAEFYDNLTGPTGARVIALQADQTFRADAALPAITSAAIAGSATGTITDEGTSAPVPGALVVALRSTDLGLAQAALTGSDGTYTLPLPAGEHYLQVVDATGRHLTEWFDDQTNPTTFSSLMTVHPGSTANASMRATVGRITGTVAEAGSGPPIGGAWVVVFGAGGSVATTTSGDGHYSISGLAPGTYNLIALDPSGSHRPEYHEDRPGPDGATPLPVTAGASLTADMGLDPT